MRHLRNWRNSPPRRASTNGPNHRQALRADSETAVLKGENMTKADYLKRIRVQYAAALHFRNLAAQAYWRTRPGTPEARRAFRAVRRTRYALNAERNRMNRMTRCLGRMRGESWRSFGPIRQLPA